MGWQWHQLDYMPIICTSLQTDNNASTSSLHFYRPDAIPAAQPTVLKHWRHRLHCNTHTQQLFYSPLSSITRVSWYQKKHSPTHHPDHHTIFISFFHLPRSIASSLFKLRALQSFCTTCIVKLTKITPQNTTTTRYAHTATDHLDAFVFCCSSFFFLKGMSSANLDIHVLSDILTYWDTEKVVDHDSCITNYSKMGDHPFVKLKVVAQNRWSLNEGLLTGTGIVVTYVSLWV